MVVEELVEQFGDMMYLYASGSMHFNVNNVITPAKVSFCQQ